LAEKGDIKVEALGRYVKTALIDRYTGAELGKGGLLCVHSRSSAALVGNNSIPAKVVKPE
jgi:hypothetical protein